MPSPPSNAVLGKEEQHKAELDTGTSADKLLPEVSGSEVGLPVGQAKDDVAKSDTNAAAVELDANKASEELTDSPEAQEVTAAGKAKKKKKKKRKAGLSNEQETAVRDDDDVEDSGEFASLSTEASAVEAEASNVAVKTKKKKKKARVNLAPGPGSAENAEMETQELPAEASHQIGDEHGSDPAYDVAEHSADPAALEGANDTADDAAAEHDHSTSDSQDNGNAGTVFDKQQDATSSIGGKAEFGQLQGPAVRHVLVKSIKKGEDKSVEAADNTWSHNSLQGAATSFSVFGVFDGHGGKFAATYAAKHLLERVLQAADRGDELPKVLHEDLEGLDPPDATTWALQEAFLARLPQACEAGFTKVDAEMKQRSRESGTTATLALACAWELVVASVGDSLAYLDTGSEVIQVSGNHRLDDNEDETKRIHEAGGELGQATLEHEPVGPLRVWPGGINMGRTLGDYAAGDVVLAAPEVRQISLPTSGCRLIIASDGLWDAVSIKAAAHNAHGMNATQAANQMMLSALKKHGLQDDITIIVVDFLPSPSDPFPPLLAKKKAGIHIDASEPSTVWRPLEQQSDWRGRLQQRREAVHGKLLAACRAEEEAAAYAAAKEAEAAAAAAQERAAREQGMSDAYRELSQLRLEPAAAARSVAVRDSSHAQGESGDWEVVGAATPDEAVEDGPEQSSTAEDDPPAGAEGQSQRRQGRGRGRRGGFERQRGRGAYRRHWSADRGTDRAEDAAGNPSLPNADQEPIHGAAHKHDAIHHNRQMRGRGQNRMPGRGHSHAQQNGSHPAALTSPEEGVPEQGDAQAGADPADTQTSRRRERHQRPRHGAARQQPAEEHWAGSAGEAAAAAHHEDSSRPEHLTAAPVGGRGRGRGRGRGPQGGGRSRGRNDRAGSEQAPDPISPDWDQLPQKQDPHGQVPPQEQQQEQWHWQRRNSGQRAQQPSDVNGRGEVQDGAAGGSQQEHGQGVAALPPPSGVQHVGNGQPTGVQAVQGQQEGAPPPERRPRHRYRRGGAAGRGAGLNASSTPAVQQDAAHGPHNEIATVAADASHAAGPAGAEAVGRGGGQGRGYRRGRGRSRGRGPVPGAGDIPEAPIGAQAPIATD